MKNINLFSTKPKSIIWILLMLAGYCILAIPFSCKDDPMLPDNSTFISSRSGDHFELLGVACLPDSIPIFCDSIPTIDSMMITLSDYPGCSFWITFEYYDCRFGSYQYYHIGSFKLISHNCSAFTTAFNAAYASGGATLAAFVENFDHDVFLKIKSNLANTLVPVGTYPCGTSYVTFMSYIRVSCFKWCYIQIGQTTSGTKVGCGSDCCSEETTACRDEHGNLILNSSSYSSDPPHCTGPILYSNEAPPGRCMSESECEFTCPE